MSPEGGQFYLPISALTWAILHADVHEGVALGDDAHLAKALLGGPVLGRVRVTKTGYKRICHLVHFRALLCVLTC